VHALLTLQERRIERGRWREKGGEGGRLGRESGEPRTRTHVFTHSRDMICPRLDNVHNYYVTNTHTQQPHTNKGREGGREGGEGGEWEGEDRGKEGEDA